MAIELLPPPGEVPLSKVKLNTGATVFPNLMDCGRVRVWDEDDAPELERRGWTRDFHSAQAKAVAAVLLQKGLSCQIRRTEPGIGWPIQKSEAPSAALRASSSGCLGASAVRSSSAASKSARSRPMARPVVSASPTTWSSMPLWCRVSPLIWARSPQTYALVSSCGVGALTEPIIWRSRRPREMRSAASCHRF